LLSASATKVGEDRRGHTLGSRAESVAVKTASVIREEISERGEGSSARSYRPIPQAVLPVTLSTIHRWRGSRQEVWADYRSVFK